jgi:hypothetical protein
MSRRRLRKPPARKSPRLLRVAFACNDGDNGIFAGRVDAISIRRNGDGLDMDGGISPRLTIGDGWLRIFRLKLRVHGYKDWVGNWCWNEYVLEQPDVAWLLVTAIRTGKMGFDAADGEEAIKLSELVEAGAPIALVEAAMANFGADR